VEARDLKALLRLSASAGPGLTTLPHDEALLKNRIGDSRRGFARMAEKPGGETYLFALEELRTRRVVGTSGVVSKVGGFEPFYAYRMETAVHASAMLGVRREIRVLKLLEEHNGPSEIGTLYLHPKHRGGIAGRLLSLGRFLFMADHLRFFDKSVLAEMRGRFDARGRSPFWEALGRHFFGIDFQLADRLILRDKRFIAELMPRHPIYIPLLPKAAQAAIGKVHPETAPALRMLEGEGFAATDMADIFEGGPVVSCAVDKIRSVKESRVAMVRQITGRRIEAEPWLLSNGRAKKFRACAAPIQLIPGRGLRIGRAAALALQVEEGDAVRFVSLRPGAEPAR
jgi:arginine N-succinyltransferase